MSNSNMFAEQAANNSPKLWVTVSFFWGTVFYITSIYALSLLPSYFSFMPVFEPSFIESLKAYPIYAVFLFAVAFGGYGFNRLYDPTGEKRKKRQDKVSKGTTETIFVSLAGSIATSFFFTFLVALAFIISNSFFEMNFNFTFQQVFFASLGNIAAGLIGSLLVGVVFLVLKLMGKFPSSQFSS
ncbi:MAG: hypothetical protein SFU91_05480 [Chloroherpetonaceae bacterium]|nr:hypothetical protein [Chloroherpetonaceae bacterium]